MKLTLLPLAFTACISFVNSNAIANESQLTPPDISQQSITKTQININDATFEQLKSIPGLGDAKANAILNYIKENGKITNIKQLAAIKGIGEKTIEKIIKKFEIGH